MKYCSISTVFGELTSRVLVPPVKQIPKILYLPNCALCHNLGSPRCMSFSAKGDHGLYLNNTGYVLKGAVHEKFSQGVIGSANVTTTHRLVHRETGTHLRMIVRKTIAAFLTYSREL